MQMQTKMTEQIGSNNRIFTSHGTIMFVDTASGELRHGLLERSPSNVIFVPEGEQARIKFCGVDSPQDIAFLPEYSAVVGSEKAATHTKSSVFFLVTTIGKEFALTERGKFLCAEPDGRITLSRSECKLWERFYTDQQYGGEIHYADPETAQLAVG